MSIEPVESQAIERHEQSGAVAEPLASERVILAAPLSYAGSAQRIWRPIMRFARPDDQVSRVALAAAAVLLITLAWTIVTTWYLAFGVLVVPYRLIRRGQRKRRMMELRHREQLAALERR